jgi:hypothetical protein
VTRQEGGQRRLAMARAARVRATNDGTPLTVDGQRVTHVRESWLVEDRWWTEQPLRRRYWELVSEAGRDLDVYHDLASGRWLRQR